MAWNEPPGGKNDQDPWARKPKGNQEGPPDLDQVFKDLNKQVSKLFGTKGGKGGGGNDKGSSNGAGGFGIIAILLVLAVGYLATQAVYTVGEQESAIVLRFGAYHSTESPGLRFKLPIVDRVEVVNTQGIREYTHRASMITSDQNIVDVTLTVQYRAENPERFALQVRRPDVSLEEAADAALRHEAGSRQLVTVMTTGRAELGEQITSRLQNSLDLYQTGIRVVRVNIREATPPSAVRSSFDDVIRATEELERLRNEGEAYKAQRTNLADAEYQSMLEEASAYAEQVVNRSSGEAARFEALLAEYRLAPDVLRQRLYLDTISEVYARTGKVLLAADGGNNLLYLPLDQLSKAGAATAANMGSQAARVAPPATSEQDIRRIADQVLNELQTRQNQTTRR